jgi:hypothetical protein
MFVNILVSYSMQSDKGSRKTFPEVQGARYGSHLLCSIEKVVNREFYLRYMEQLGNAKNKHGFTNVEKNVNIGLQCMSTLTEDCAAALYFVLVDLPYMLRVRGGRDANGMPENQLDMGPFHDKLMEYCKRIADDPSILLDGAQPPTTFTGEAMAQPEVFDAVIKLSSSLPYLPAILGAFFRGAHAKWITFTAEFAQTEQIANLSPAERRAAFLSTTNDVNEGALGMLRVALRKFPNLSLEGYNARMMIRRNNVAGYMRNLSRQAWRFCHDEARRIARNSTERRRRNRLAELRVQKALTNVRERAAKRQKAEEQSAQLEERLAGVHLELDADVISAMKGADLAIQIQLHRRLGDLDPTTGKSVVPPTSKLKVHEKKIVVLELAARRRELHGEVSNIEVEMGGSVASADKAEDAMVRILQVSGVLRC